MESPEMVAAQAVIEKIRPDLVSEELRDAVLEAAKAATMRREVAEQLDTARAELATALIEGDVPAGVAAAGLVMMAERLQSQLPSAEVPPHLIEAALHLAARVVDGAEPGPLPVPAFEREWAAYRELTPRYQAAVEPPIMLPSDLDAKKAVAGLHDVRGALERTIAAWRQAATPPVTVEPLGLLVTAGDIVTSLGDKCAAQLAEVAEVISRADQERADSGFSWRPPTGGALAPPELAIRAT